MKRIFSFVALIALICMAIVPTVSAEAENASLSAYLLKGELKQGETVTIRFELNGLKGTSGAVMTENHFLFDPDIVEFISCKANHPDGWDFENEFAEDWSSQDQKVQTNGSVTLLNSFSLTLLDAKMGHPVCEDHVFYLDVELKLKNDVDSLSFEANNCYWASFEKNDAGKMDFVRHDLKAQTIQLSLTSPDFSDGIDGLSVGVIIALIIGAAVLIAGVVTAVVLKKKKAEK